MTHPTLYYPLSIKEAGMLSWAADFVWPSDVGPLEEAFRIAEFGAFFLTGGTANTILFVASCLGLSLQSFGKLLDGMMGWHSLKDVIGANPSEIVSKLTGDLPPAEKQPQETEQQALDAHAEVEEAFVKIAAKAPDVNDPNYIPWSIQDQKDKALKRKKDFEAHKAVQDALEKDPAHQEDLKEMERHREEQKFKDKMRHDELVKEKNRKEMGWNLSKHQDRNGNPSQKSYGVLTEAVEKFRMKAKISGRKGAIWNTFLAGMAIVASWAIETVTRIVNQPWDNKFEIAKAAGKMAASKAVNNGLTARIADPKPGSPTAQVMDDSRQEVFPKEPPKYADRINLAVEQVLSGAG